MTASAPFDDEVLADDEVPPLYRAFPRTRGECEGGPRPCPWARCKFSLIDIRLGPDEIDIDAMTDTCVLDVIDRSEPGEPTLDQIGRMVGLTRERVRVIELTAILKMRRKVEGAPKHRDVASMREILKEGK